MLLCRRGVGTLVDGRRANFRTERRWAISTAGRLVVEPVERSSARLMVVTPRSRAPTRPISGAVCRPPSRRQAAARSSSRWRRNPRPFL
jgi:hypothetical protein